MTIEGKKLYLIRKIMEISDESVIDQLDGLIGKQPEEDKDWILRQLNKPIKEKLDLEEVKREQNFEEVNKEEIETLIKEADIQEPIEELLQMV
jgi:hypothetical protein